ncbi:PP2C family protein-serine/threonine phosphatase [Kitasatospora sp. NPDC088783]|uniref:PP2C family protein-serine/threonine phosphatase n=1 Tax=Kitasatospora sp. NPDC088783 TaxID=3364077 RepID=UPI00382D5A9F
MTDVHPLTSPAPAATALPPAPTAPAAPGAPAVGPVQAVDQARAAGPRQAVAPADAVDPALLPEFGEVPSADLQDRLAGWLSDFTSLQEHLELLARADGLTGTLDALLDSGAALLGARRGLVVTLPPGADRQPARPVGLGLDRAMLGALETVPVEHGPFAGLLGRPGPDGRLLIADLAADPAVGPRFREVAEQLGLGACYALPLATGPAGALGAAAWFYDEPGSPDERREHLARRYCEFAAPLLARQLEADRAVRAAETLRRSLLPGHLPTLAGLKVAARCVPAALERAANSDWYDAVALPDDTVGLTVGSVLGGGPGAGPGAGADAAAAMGRVRSALRAYAVLEGEDPVSVLGDLELLLKTTEPTRSATAVYACVDPAERRIALAGAANCPPVLLTRYGANFVETSLSAPLGMLSCWEAPGVELTAERGDVLVLYTEGLARRFAPNLHAGQSALRRAAADAPRDVRLDPDRLCAHLLEQAGGGEPGGDDLVLLAVRFE